MSIEFFSSDKRLIQDFLLAASQRPIIIIVHLPTRINSNRQFFGVGLNFTRQFYVFFSLSLDSFSHGWKLFVSNDVMVETLDGGYPPTLFRCPGRVMVA